MRVGDLDHEHRAHRTRNTFTQCTTRTEQEPPLDYRDIDVWVYRHARGTRLARSSHDRHVRVRSTRPAHIAESSQHMPHCTLGSPARSPDPTARTRAFHTIAMTHLRAVFTVAHLVKSLNVLRLPVSTLSAPRITPRGAAYHRHHTPRPRAHRATVRGCVAEGGRTPHRRRCHLASPTLRFKGC